MSYEETKKKKEKDFRLSPIQYPEPGSNFLQFSTQSRGRTGTGCPTGV